MKQIAVVVGSHGEFAKYALESAEMIVGKQENCAALSVLMEDTLPDAIFQMEEKLAPLDTSSGVVILVDIFGGTPSNVSGTIVLKREDALVISGLNLPMLIVLLLNRDKSIDELEKLLEDAYQKGFTNITRKLKESEELEDEYPIL